MIELPLVFLGGLLGSAHCIGMCGGFAISIGLGCTRVGRQCATTAHLHGRPDLHLFVPRRLSLAMRGGGSRARPADG